MRESTDDKTMTTVTTKIVFPAVLAVYQFESQVVKLGGVFPEIEIENIDSLAGLHYFKIAKVLPHYGETMIASAVAESESEIDVFWNILAYVRDTSIKATGQIFYEVDGNLQEFHPRPKTSLTASLVGRAGDRWFDDKIPQFHKSYNYDLLKRFNYSRSIEEPIGKFLSLYSLLSSLCEDRQAEIDKLIEGVDGNIGKCFSPKTGKPETLFTRLRNELAHHRIGNSVMEDDRNVEIHLQRFEWIVKVIIGRGIELV